jgi:dipeptidyl aminopeptidase/acylaminoacyl peptidase
LTKDWGNDFDGNILSYTTKSDGGVYILGQLGINGIYQLMSSSSINSVAFVFSSFSKGQEAYFISDINHFISAKTITNETSQYDQINLPEGEPYRWTNDEDNRIIGGILHYPPEKFQEKNLPLLFLIHFLGACYNWAPIAASEGWLVLEPNYQGSSEYDDLYLLIHFDINH